MTPDGHNWSRYRRSPNRSEVLVTTKSRDDLQIQPLLVVLDRQPQVGAQLGGGLENAGETMRCTLVNDLPSFTSVHFKIGGKGHQSSTRNGMRPSL
jgi:hypothetical protein